MSAPSHPMRRRDRELTEAEALAILAKALAKEAAAKVSARKAALAATRALTDQLKLSRRDAAALTGYSFQRIQQLTERT